jgi:hypothetical protein
LKLIGFEYLPNFCRKIDLTLFLVSMLLGFEILISDRLEVEPISDSSGKISDGLISATDLITPSFSYIRN